MKFKLLFLLGLTSFCTFCTDYGRRAQLLKATKVAFLRVAEHQPKIRRLDLHTEKERAVVLKLLKKEQALMFLALSDANKLDNTPDVEVRKSFNQVLVVVGAVITHLLKDILYKNFDGPFFLGAYQALGFCQEVHIKKLSKWANGSASEHIDSKIVNVLNKAIEELKKTLKHIPENYS